MRYRVLRDHDVKVKSGVLSDQTIELSSAHGPKAYPDRLRRGPCLVVLDDGPQVRIAMSLGRTEEELEHLENHTPNAVLGLRHEDRLRKLDRQRVH